MPDRSWNRVYQPVRQNILALYLSTQVSKQETEDFDRIIDNMYTYNGVFHVFHVKRSVNIFLLNRKMFYVTKICVLGSVIWNTWKTPMFHSFGITFIALSSEFMQLLIEKWGPFNGPLCMVGQKRLQYEKFGLGLKYNFILCVMIEIQIIIFSCWK